MSTHEPGFLQGLEPAGLGVSQAREVGRTGRSMSSGVGVAVWMIPLGTARPRVEGSGQIPRPGRRTGRPSRAPYRKAAGIWQDAGLEVGTDQRGADPRPFYTSPLGRQAVYE